MLDIMLYTLSLFKKQNFLPLLKFSHSSFHLTGFPSSCNRIITLTSTHLPSKYHLRSLLGLDKAPMQCQEASKEKNLGC